MTNTSYYFFKWSTVQVTDIGDILNLIFPAKINLFQPRFKFMTHGTWQIAHPSYPKSWTCTREPWPLLRYLDSYLGTQMQWNCLHMTRTWEIRPVLGNLDPYSGTHSICSKGPKYNTHQKNASYFIIFTVNFLVHISTTIIDALAVCHFPWVTRFQSGLKKIDFSRRY